MTRWTFLIVLIVVVAGCDESDLSSIHVSVNSDGSGTVRLNSVSVPDSSGALEGTSAGVEWAGRVNLRSSIGSFTSLDGLRSAGIVFETNTTERGIRSVDVIVPLAADATWRQLFSPNSVAQRIEAAEAFDATGRAKSIGCALKIVVELPAEVIAGGITRTKARLKHKTSGKVATLSLPVDIESDVDAVVWHLTWAQ